MSNMFDNNYFRRWFLIIFALFCVGINVAAVILYQKNETLNTSKEWVAHTYEVIAAEYNLFSLIQDRQGASRGYLITGSPDFLKQYEQADKKIKSSIDRIKELVGDNQVQKDQLTAYIADIEDIAAVNKGQMEVKNSGAPFDPLDISETKPRMDKLRAHHANIIGNERDLLDIRKAREEQLQKNFILTLFGAAGLSAIGLLIANGIVAFLTYRRRSAEENLVRTNQEMEGFTYIASHDLRSPLVNLKGFSTEMKYSIDELKPLIERNKSAISPEDFKAIETIVDHDLPDALRYIHSSVEKMDKLTNAILELSRIGRRNLDLRPINTERIVQHVLDTLHHTITTKNIKVTVRPLPDVVADQLSLEQVFGNIIDNATKYLDPSRTGQIEIGGSRAYRETKFWVKDNGRGIEKVDYQKIFEIYRRAGNSDNIPGEGMGMAYVRTTLRRLGGQIWCESTPGMGAIFYFTISNSLKKDNER